MSEGSVASTRVARAIHLEQLGRYADARTLLAEELASDPDNATAAAYLADSCLSLGDYPAAAAAADAALRVRPDSEFGLRARALAQNALGEERAAAAAARRAVELGPDSAANYRVLATVTRTDPAVALPAIQRALELTPQNANLHWLRGSILLQQSKAGLRTSGQAAESFGRALDIDPAHAAAAHDLAIVRLRAGRLGAAADGLLRVGELDPAAMGPLVRRNIGLVVHRALVRLHLLMFLVVGAVLLFGAAPETTGSRTFDVVTGPGRSIGLAGLAAVVAVVIFGLRSLPRRQWPNVWSTLRTDVVSIARVLLLCVVFLLVLLAIGTGSADPIGVAMPCVVFGALALQILRWILRSVKERRHAPA
ncbi:tetratricopeptide repeat protein [Nocardia goodfellowii]|uniref:Tetratricopeptide (TPR) repeat protein n=1 Tax=Nocardia goodfellowii TaxID=882446 RepID=A0ABS4Q8C4_9NOCA|nr:tetratricopeptide repeat protein [Nocardia goodfellowii]MBP2187938.1 tetratricopeptide (TPR) repeat protein [Nocardia goodfellowii]